MIRKTFGCALCTAYGIYVDRYLLYIGAIFVDSDGDPKTCESQTRNLYSLFDCNFVFYTHSDTTQPESINNKIVFPFNVFM